MATFYEVLTLAVNDFVDHGFDSEERLKHWLKLLEDAAKASLIPESELRRVLVGVLQRDFDRLVTQNGLLKYHKGLSTGTIAKLKPTLKLELDRRVMASANLIKLNRQEAISNTLRRFSGAVTAIPPGGSDVIDKNETKKAIKKSLAGLTFESRRVAVDQSHKFFAAVNDIVAKDNSAIAAEWNDHHDQPGYNYRPEHKARDKKVYLIRKSWATERGLIKPVNGYTDDIETPAQLPFCRCYYRYIYSIGAIPPEFLTDKGREELAEAKRKARELMGKN